MKKLWICILAILAGMIACWVLAIMLLGGSNDEVSRKRIIEYVDQNHETLEFVIQDGIPDEESEQEALIRDRFGKQNIVKSISKYSDSKIGFYCGGTGNATNSTYSGFYFSAADKPFALMFSSEAKLEETSPGVYEWKSSTGKEIITERIMPNWFYYHIVWN
ncbi:MAG: hypothetical protein IKO51_09075 [Clostridia bacterium]|nr:hypothetical protein [Clostridia bacterium]